MSNIPHTTSRIADNLSLKLIDTRALLTAIEAMIVDQRWGLADRGREMDGLHALIQIALEKAREAESLSDELEESMIAARRAA